MFLQYLQCNNMKTTKPLHYSQGVLLGICVLIVALNPLAVCVGGKEATLRNRVL